MNNQNFENLIHMENDLYCLNDIAEKLILSKNVKEYIKKINNKEWIKGNYYISKENMKNILSKSKTVIGQQYLNFISDRPKENKIIVEDKKDTTKHMTTKENLQSKIDNRKFIDHGSNEIIYNNKRILFFEYNEVLYLKANDVCDLLGYTNYSDAINRHIDKEDILMFKICIGNGDRESRPLFPNDNLSEYISISQSIPNIDNVERSHKTRLPFPNSDLVGNKVIEAYQNTIHYDDLPEYINNVPNKANQDIEHLKKIKLMIEEKTKKFIDPKTIFINESGLYSLILSSKMPEAKKFKHWVTSDVLVSIRKTGSYNRIPVGPIYDDLKLKELEDVPCVYIIHVKDSLYKFGRTKKSFRRMNEHKNNLEFNEIIKIFELQNLDMAVDVENQIKKYTISIKIRKYLEEGIEFFEVNKDYTFERVFKEINNIVDSHMSLYEKKINNSKLDALSYIENLRLDEYNVLLNIEREKSKQAELEIRRKELDLEILRLKSNNIQQLQPQPSAPQQTPPPSQTQPSAPPPSKPKKKYVQKKKTKTKKCIDCDTLIIDKSTRCSKCIPKFKLVTAIATSNRPTLGQLEEELKTNTFVSVGIRYGVSDNTIRSWIKQYKKHII